MDTKLNLATKFKCHDVVIDVSLSERRSPELDPQWRVGNCDLLCPRSCGTSFKFDFNKQNDLARVSLETCSPILFSQPLTDLSFFINLLHSKNS